MALASGKVMAENATVQSVSAEHGEFTVVNTLSAKGTRHEMLGSQIKPKEISSFFFVDIFFTTHAAEVKLQNSPSMGYFRGQYING